MSQQARDTIAPNTLLPVELSSLMNEGLRRAKARRNGGVASLTSLNAEKNTELTREATAQMRRTFSLFDPRSTGMAENLRKVLSALMQTLDQTLSSGHSRNLLLSDRPSSAILNATQE